MVLGPSGSGKSTLCRTINRLEPIDSGTISIDGELLPEEGRKLAQLRSDVGMVFQSFNLFAHKTILENVMLAPVKVRKTAKDKARDRGEGAAGARRDRQPGRQVPCAAVGRAAAARGDRPIPGDEPQGDAVRRTHQRARSRDDQRGAGRDDRPGQRGHDDAGGDPRDGLRAARLEPRWCSWPTVRSSRTPNPRSSSPIRSPTAPKTFSARSSTTEVRRKEHDMPHRECRASGGRRPRARRRPAVVADRLWRWWRDDSKIVIGTKFDQPGLGLKNPDGTMSGFDVDVATYVAGQLGYTPEQDRVEGVAVGSARDPDPERSGQVHRGDLLDHRRAQGEGRPSPGRTWSPDRACW